MAGSQDSWIRRFAITETSKHQKNFTIYKVSYMVSFLIFNKFGFLTGNFSICRQFELLNGKNFEI